MNRNDIARLLVEAKRVTNHRDYVVIGSLSVRDAASPGAFKCRSRSRP